jgi:hypothetical protein
MSITIPVKELYFLMGVNGIGFIPDSPFSALFEKFSRKPQDLNIEKLGVSLYSNGFITSTETLSPTKDIQNKIDICAAPNGFYSVLARFYNKMIYTEFYEKDGEIVEFSSKDNVCYFKETGTRKRLTESIQTVLNGTEKPQIPSLQFSIPEYILLGAAFYLQEISDLTGPLEETGKPIHFSIADLKEEISSNPKFDIVDALSEIGSGYEHSTLIKDDTILRAKVEKLIAKGYLQWVDPSTDTLNVGPAAQRFYELMTKPSALFISIAGSDMKTFDIKNKLSFFWSDKNLFKVFFEKESIVFTGIEKPEVGNILSDKILIPIEKAEKEIETEQEIKPRTKNFCPKCGWKNERGALFCPKCGKSLRSDS